MTSRLLAAGAALWAVLFAGGYVWLIGQQDDGAVAGWYLGILVVATVSLMIAAGRRNRPAAVVGAVLLAVATVLGLLSIGVLLLPAVIAAVISAATMPARSGMPVNRRTPSA